MIANKKVLSILLVLAALTLAADQPGLIASGSAHTHDGWRLSYSTVVKPPVAGQSMSISNGLLLSETDASGRAVFHRYIADPAAKVFFGYDVLIVPNGGSAKLAFRPLSIRPEDLPPEFQTAGSRLVEIRQFPNRTFESGQTIGITLAMNPASGQKVVDYVHVEFSYFDRIAQALEDWSNAIAEAHRNIFAHHRRPAR
jgi:hypothetical protein